ncbi:MAG TPA: RpiB/LacA/LacB family sugar-phosphate isomerase [Kofleriaceae bacterium]|nr:RpiB/LacA/LacB family sugar-phosphate isomerase [Kofleriaceae bacterium]
MIRRLGSHAGKRILFGYDRYLIPDLDVYRDLLLGLGRELIEAVDVGQIHYLTSAERVCRAIQQDPDSFGILCCGTGMGMSIAANKFPGIYAARCTTVEDAEMSRQINNANVLCIAAKQGFDVNRAILEAFARTHYTGRKLDELEYITRFEQGAPAASESRPMLRTA